MKYEVLGNDKQADLNLYVCERDEKIAPGVRYGPVIRDSYIIECCTEGEEIIIIKRHGIFTVTRRLHGAAAGRHRNSYYSLRHGAQRGLVRSKRYENKLLSFRRRS